MKLDAFCSNRVESIIRDGINTMYTRTSDGDKTGKYVYVVLTLA